MKVTKIETVVCYAYRNNWVFVFVHTDKGITGIGEATIEFSELAVQAAVHELERMLVGRDPHDIELFWRDAYRGYYYRSGPIMSSALAGVEMALWDIKGKDLGVPVYQLLGGKVRDRVPCYANGWFAPATEPDEFAAKAKIAVEEMGFKALKWDPFGSAWLTLTPQEFDKAIACVAAVKEAIKGKGDIIIEGHGRFDMPTALRMGKALEPYEPLFFEEPLTPEDDKGLAELKSRLNIPISGGERVYSRWRAVPYLEMGCVDVFQPDTSHFGGIGEIKKIAAVAEVKNIPVCPHNPIGPVANAANLQLAACVPNFWLLETMATDVPWRKEICTEHMQLIDGEMTIPDKPGLGIELHPEAMKKYPYKAENLRHYNGTLTAIRPEGSTSWFEKQS
ncbi:MAG TPA: galactonate dehydratase [Phycisphaerales bacterium]|nr:galactonate dehydratase [Phycisphaerales bacterium]HCD32791.1 galactonate dehydratase [Phycisphaerales bacterium]